MMVQFFKKLFLLVLVSFSCRANTDLVVFSYNRPLQLFAFLESCERYVRGIDTCTVLLKADSDDYDVAYKEVAQRFPEVLFLRQNNQAKGSDFKPLVLKAVYDAPAEYVLFAVDDIVVTDYIDLNACINALQKYNAYGFYLRMGKNVQKNYPHNCSMKTPEFLKQENGLCVWRIGDGDRTWRYPNTVDMTVYKKSDILRDLRGLNYFDPNTFEGNWSMLAPRYYSRLALCYEYSKMVNVPINRVQDTNKNRTMDAISAKELLALFNRGLKIDIDLLYQMRNEWTHQEYMPTFIKRS